MEDATEFLATFDPAKFSPNIGIYLDRAIEAIHADSDRGLARELKVAPSAVNSWRKGKYWPSDFQMTRIAELSGADVEIALLWLNVWRAPAKVRPYYMRLLERAGAITLTRVTLVLLPLLFWTAPAPAYAPETGVSNLYIMRLLRMARTRRWTPEPASFSPRIPSFR